MATSNEVMVDAAAVPASNPNDGTQRYSGDAEDTDSPWAGLDARVGKQCKEDLVFEHYRIPATKGAELGKGSFGTVFAATDTRSNERVAIKAFMKDRVVHVRPDPRGGGAPEPPDPATPAGAAHARAVEWVRRRRGVCGGGGGRRRQRR